MSARFLILFLVVGSCLSLTYCGYQSTPGSESNASPQGIDSLIRYKPALDFLASHCKYDSLHETILIHQGRIVFQGDSTHKKHDIWSCTKSFTSTIFGLLVEEGIVQLDDKVYSVLPELEAKYPLMTFRHLLTMTSGYNANGINRWDDPSEDWSTTPYDMGDPIFAPGTAYAYWDEAMMLFGKAITVLLKEPTYDFLKRKIGDPLGWSNWDWWATDSLTDGTPIHNGCTGIKINASQMADFATLYLQEGQWNGQQLIPTEWIEMATRSQVDATTPIGDTDRSNVDGAGKYGFNWWIYTKSDDIPVDAYYASGFNHNVCLVIPAWDMILIRMGVDGNPPAGKHFVYGEVLKLLDKHKTFQ